MGDNLQVKRVWTGAQVEAIKAARQSDESRLRNEAKWEAEERKRKCLEESDRKRREEAEERRKRVEAETKRLLEEEEERLREERALERRREEKRLAEQIIERRKMEEIMDRQMREEMEERRRQVAEELKKKIKEEKFGKFERRNKPELRVAPLKPRRPNNNQANKNPIVSRFEGIADFRKATERDLREKEEATKLKKHPVKDRIRRSAQKLAAALSGNKKRDSNEDVYEQDDVVGSMTESKGSHDNPLKRSKSSQKLISSQNGDKKANIGQMQNYLISKVLFDGEEEVHVQSKEAKEDEDKIRRAKEELAKRERAFQEYQEDVERYLSLFGEEKTRKKKEASTDNGKSQLSRKPIANLDDIRGKFEDSEGNDAGERKNKNRNVGKLQIEEIFSDDTNNEEEKKKYSPVIIDKDAFSRTMTKFEEYRQEEDMREKRKQEVKDRAETKRKEKERRQQEELERQDEMLRQMEEEEERMKEEELKKQIIDELERLRKLEEKQKEKAERENKKREMMLKKVQKEIKTKEDDDKEEVPQWIKLVSDAKERKAYITEKHPELLNKKPLDLPSFSRYSSSSSSNSYESCEAAMVDREDSDEFDADVAAMLDLIDEADAKALVDELNLEEEEEEETPDSSYQEARGSTEQELQLQDERKEKLKSFDDSIDEMLELLGEEECAKLAEELALAEKDRENESKKKIVVKKPRPKANNVGLVDMTRVKSKLLQPKTAPAPKVKVSLANVSKVKEMLLNKLTGGDGKSKEETPRKVKGLNTLSIKKAFDKRYEEETAPKGPVVRKKKTLIEVPVSPSIDQQLESAKAKNRTKKWSYQDIKEIKPEQKVTTSEKSKMRENSFSSAKPAKSEVVSPTKINDNEGDEFISEVYNYIRSSKADDPNDSEGLQGLVNTYLELSQRRDNESKRKELSFDYVPNTEKIKQRLASKNTEEPKQNNRPLVGKIKDPDALLKTLIRDDDEFEKQKTPSVDSYACELLKDKYERLEREKKESGMSRERQKAIQKKIWGADTVNNPPPPPPPPPPKQERKTQKEWTWKKKLEEAAKLAAIAKANEETAKKNLKRPSVTTVIRKTEDIEKLEDNRRAIMENSQKREEEFLKIMEDLKSIKAKSDLPATQDFDTVLSSYLDAVDQSESRHKGALPQLTSPIKVESIKSKIESGKVGKKKAEGNKGKIVGKIKVDLDRRDSDDKGGRERDPVLETMQTDRIKRMFESSKAKNDNKNKIKPEKVWEPPPKEKKAPAAPIKNEKRVYKYQLPENKPKPKLSINSPPKPPAEPKRSLSLQESRGWEHISDPEEKKKAILAKYGFKPPKPQRNDDDDVFDDIDTIPSHVLKDEILYQRYMRQQLNLDNDDSSCSDSDISDASLSSLDSSDSLPSPTSTRKSKKPTPTTSSSFRKVLGNFKKIQKGSGGDSKQSKSNLDVSSGIGSLKSKFDRSVGSLFRKSDDDQEKRRSCSDLKDLWEQKLNPSSSKKKLNQAQPLTQERKKIQLTGKHVENVKNRLKNGEDSADLVKKFFNRQRRVDESNGEYVRKAKEAILSDSSSEVEPDRFKSQEISGILRQLQDGRLSEDECKRQLDEAENRLKSRYFEDLCQNVSGTGSRVAELQRQLEELEMAPSQDMEGDSNNGANEWHRKNYEEQKNRIASELQALRQGSMAMARDDLERMLSGERNNNNVQRSNHLGVAAKGGGAVNNLKGQLVRQMSEPNYQQQQQAPKRQQSSKDAMQERARQLFMANCNELQQLPNRQQPIRSNSNNNSNNVNALRGRLATNMSPQQHQHQQQQQPRPPPRKLSAGSINLINEQQHQKHAKFPTKGINNNQSISQLQEKLAASLLENPSGAEVVYSPSASSSDAVATVREKLESLFDGSSEEWNKIFPEDCDSCANLRKTLEDNLRRNQPQRQQQQPMMTQQRQGPPSHAVGSAQKGLIKLMSNDYDKGSSTRKGGFIPSNKGSISEKQKQLFSPQQQQQQQQQYVRRPNSKEMGLKKDVIENLFAADRINSQMGNGGNKFVGGNKKCSEMRNALQSQMTRPTNNLQFCRPQPQQQSNSASLKGTRNMLDSFFSGNSQTAPSSYRQPPPRTKSLSDVKSYLQRQFEGGNSDDYKNDYGVGDAVRSDKVKVLRKQMSDMFSNGSNNQSSQRNFPRTRSACESMKDALERQQVADSSYVPYSPGDCPRSESVASLRNKLNTMWDDSSRPSSRGFNSLQQTKSCSNIKNALQEQWNRQSQNQYYGGRQVAVVAPSVSVSNMKSLFDSCYSSLPQSDGSMDAALTMAARDPARRRQFEDMMRVLESGASTLEDQGARNAVYSELENLRRTLALRSLDEAVGADHSDFERQRYQLRQELEEVRAARGAIDKSLLARLVSGEERRMQNFSGREAELEAVRARRRATGGSMDDVNDWHQKNYQEQRDKIQLELEALRGRVKASLLKIEQGGSTLDRDNLEAELEAVKSARRRYNMLEAELLAGKRAGGFTERQRIQNELAALRESRKGSSLNKINFGVEGMGARSKSSSDLDADTVREMRRSKAKARAMFESQAPKYKFGGSGEKLLSEEDDELMLRPRRPRVQQQKPKEERKWVADTINKYFDVIVEEDEEENAKGSRQNQEYDQDEEDENKEIFYPDSDDDDDYDDEDIDRLGKGENFKSTSNIRGLLSHVLGRVSRSNAGASKEALVGALKQNLGTQMAGTTDL